MASGLILDYLGSGNVADRPATPNLYTGSLGLWFATDTEVLSLWDGATWTDVTGSAVTSVNGLTGTVVLALGDLDDVDAAAPSDGDVLAWNSADGEWQPSPPGGAPDAEQVSYNNTTSGLTATDVQAAIDEIVAGAGSGPTSYSIVTEASAFTADPGTHDGLFRYIRSGGDVTFDDAEPYTAGMVFNIRATASIELLEDGVTLTPPAGGTLELSSGMAVQVVMTSATAGDVIGQTVAA